MSVPLKPLKWYRELATRKGCLEASAFLVEGVKAINQIVSGHPDKIIEILAIEEPPPEYRGYPVRTVTEKQFHYISNTRTPQGTAAVISLPAEIYSSSLPGDTGDKILLMEDIQDPGNVGTLIRTAAAFGFTGAILTGSCADPLSPKCIQATAGSVLSIWLRRTPDYLELANRLKAKGYPLIAADLSGTDEPTVLSRQDKLVLALGSEAVGLSKKLLDMADYRVKIHTIPEKAESLNVASCGAILMYLSS